MILSSASVFGFVVEESISTIKTQYSGDIFQGKKIPVSIEDQMDALH